MKQISLYEYPNKFNLVGGDAVRIRCGVWRQGNREPGTPARGPPGLRPGGGEDGGEGGGEPAVRGTVGDDNL